MFPIETSSDLSYVQLWLLHWVQVYDWAFSLSEKEKPSQMVIEDDVLFDEWYRSHTAHKMGEARGAGASRKGASSHDKVITF